ncbi:hypothetical protein QYH69_19970 [Paraburkholderia sp. SARCC-3016]|jgi:hypothetical protein|uniref:hypothetical protein n=1 Tax=Paraburkholderia sp. SARCC-3016 TaxID=3058611 RepID=UPI002806D192|nr:hypothetical protein [Paraburkholderia sp. SARCC-3016]MDQ7979530.1 hypothetical protein [Paraburkholderia sp. SARCC-3016]
MARQTRNVPLQTLTREQLEKRIDLLERVNRTAIGYADQYSKQVARIGAIARAVKRAGVTLQDRIALVEAMEALADQAETEAALDRDCIEWVCACPPEEWDDVHAELNRMPADATRH